MFNKDYKEAMDSITPSSEVKEKILDKIELKRELKSRKNPALPWRIAFSVVACAAIVLGLLFVPKNNILKTSAPTLKVDSLNKQNSYNDVYKILRDKKIMAKWNNIFNFGYAVDDEYVFNESDGTAMPGNTNGNASDKGGDSVDITDDALSKDDYSGTTEQVEGVAEADIIKTDGKYIYYLIADQNPRVKIVSANKENSEYIGEIDLTVNDDSNYANYNEMFLKDDRLIILQTYHSYVANDQIADSLKPRGNSSLYTSIVIYDVGNPNKPQYIATVCQQGFYNSARMVGDYIYLISNCDIDLYGIDKDDPASFVPNTIYNGECKPVPADKIYCYGDDFIELPQYSVVGAYNYTDGKMTDSASILGGTHQIYCSKNNIILTKTAYYGVDEKESGITSSTLISRLEINDGTVKYKYSGEIDGQLENQFFIDEYENHFRFVTTVTKTTVKTTKFANTEEEIETYSSSTSAQLTVLNNKLEKTGEIKDLAPDENVYSVRFMGDTAYFVTFRQVDPLFSADLSDPKNPKIIGKLKIPGFSEYMYPYGEGLLLGFGQDADESTGRAGDLKLSMFNISDPANVTESDKTVIDGYSYSEALYNHKEMLVSPAKNIIGFFAHDSYGNGDYMIYKYSKGGFVKLATLRVSENYKHFGVRGIFINDGFYTINNEGVTVYDIDTFAPLKTLQF